MNTWKMVTADGHVAVEAAGASVAAEAVVETVAAEVAAVATVAAEVAAVGGNLMPSFCYHLQ